MSTTYPVFSEGQRSDAVRAINERPLGFIVRASKQKRTLPQNDRLHGMVRRVAEQLPWDGRMRSVEHWKLLFLDALQEHLEDELEMVPNLSGTGFVELGRHTSELSKDECKLFMDLVEAFAAQNGVTLWEEMG